MAFPTTLDSFTNPSASDEMDDAGLEHDVQHSQTNDAIEALEAKVGVDSSAVTSSLDYKVANRQPLDADLTAIAGLDSSTSGAIASDGAGWIKKTYAQFKTALSLAKGDVGLGNVDNTADTAKPVSTAQQTALDAKVGLTGDETVAGVKTFSSRPLLPASSPTTDNEATRKKYVDDLIAGIASGAMTLIATTTLGSDAASISFTSIPSTYKAIYLTYQIRSARAGQNEDSLLLRFNNDSGSNYDDQFMRGNNTTATAGQQLAATSIRLGNTPGATAPTGAASAGDLMIPYYAKTTWHKQCFNRSMGKRDTASTDVLYYQYFGFWRDTTAINRVDIIGGNANLLTGSVATIYGIS